MRSELVQWLCCVECGAALICPAQAARACDGPTPAEHIEEGWLVCQGCRRQFPIVDGVPQLLRDVHPLTQRTDRVYGYLWAHAPARSAPPAAPEATHLARVLERHALPPITGVWVDAGCGDGADLLAIAQRTQGIVIGVDISRDGTAMAYRRTRHLPHVHVVRGDLTRLPLRAGQCQVVYSYGVLHHVPTPEAGFRELVRLLEPEGTLLIYLYEDFQRRSRIERLALWCVNRARPVSTRLPPPLLFRLCQGAAVIIAVTCAWPARLLQRWALTRPLAERLPYRHTTRLRVLANDLYDRFGAPVEYRYDGAALERWFQTAGFADIRVQSLRGWLVTGRKSEPKVVACS